MAQGILCMCHVPHSSPSTTRARMNAWMKKAPRSRASDKWQCFWVCLLKRPPAGGLLLSGNRVTVGQGDRSGKGQGQREVVTLGEDLGADRRERHAIHPASQVCQPQAPKKKWKLGAVVGGSGHPCGSWCWGFVHLKPNHEELCNCRWAKEKNS